MTVHLVDDLPPESVAMLQALYSRSPASVVTHLEQVQASGPERFMDRYYVGYGHDSIGDCGTTTLFIEDVSMLAAKAIQDWPLYRGQEASTRYMDFSQAKMTDPVGTLESRKILDRWMSFYQGAQEPLKESLFQQFPLQPGEDPATYRRAINARLFDILRAFLPAGTNTNLSWHTDIRQARDHVMWLVRHPDHTICAVGVEIRNKLIEKYPSSFQDPSQDDPEVASWILRTAQLYTYNNNNYFTDDPYRPYRLSRTPVVTASFGMADVRRYRAMFETRPRRAVLPRFLDQYGQLQSSYLLDFGSFRDLQRHRNGVVRMPLLTTRWGLHPWYYDQLPVRLRDAAIGVVSSNAGAVDRLNVPETAKQYYLPLGFQVPCLITQTLPAFVYRLELRCSKTVHPTLRAAVQKEASLFRERFPEVALHVDMSPDTWTIRRGKQTILPR